MKILVVAAVPNELKVIKEGIKSAGIKANLDIDYLCCGAGNYEAISSLEHYLTKDKEAVFVRNIGICECCNPKKEKKTDPFQVASVVNVHTQKEVIIPPFLQIAPLKTCFCGEVAIVEGGKFDSKSRITDDEVFFDMESRGIDFVASKYKYPRLILKVPFLFVGECDKKPKGRNKDLSMGDFEILRKLPYYEYLCKIIDWINKQ